MVCGTAAQLKRFCPGMQLIYPGMMALCGPNVKFYWNSDLQRELDNLKACLKEHIKLSPIDITKNLILIIDAAATVGCSYILVQQKSEKEEDGYNFISMDSSNFKKGQLSLCPFEAEIAALRYACRKEDHYLKCCPEVTVKTDCKEMISTHAKPLESIENRRVQKMLMDVAHLNLKIEHVPGFKNCTADIRSRRPRDTFEAVCEQVGANQA